MDQLVFGTDGWRDIIGERYTFGNIARAAQAYAAYLTEQGTPSVVVGYDTRFNGRLFAEVVADVMAANGVDTRLAADYLPTPALSFAVKHLGVGGGVMLTASHNPPPYHGFKLKGAYGGTATPDIYAAVSARANALKASQVRSGDAARPAYGSFDVREAYFEALTALVDIEVLRDFDGPLAHDAMGGAGAGWLSDLLGRFRPNGSLHEIRGRPDPMFYGVNPEPIPANLAPAVAFMRESDAVFAAATDGDADRLGLVLPGGVFFGSHQIFAVLIDHLHRKGRRGRVVKTFTVSRIIERLAARRGLEVVETPVGFKYIVDAMLDGDVLVGGEESGGIGVAGHLPERDGLANSLLLLEAVATSGKPLAELFAELERETGWRHAYDRLDLKLRGNALKDAVMASLADPPASFAGRELESVETRDGVKLNLSGDAWLLFRASGTEPVLRIYCEAPTSEAVADILGTAQGFVDGLAAVQRI